MQADFGFDNPFPVVKSQKSEFEAYLRNAYLGDANNIAKLTNAYIYDTNTNQWKTLSGESYVADVLNALNIMGGGDLMGYYTEKAKEVKAKQEAELEQLKSALQTLGVETEEKEVAADAE